MNNRLERISSRRSRQGFLTVLRLSCLVTCLLTALATSLAPSLANAASGNPLRSQGEEWRFTLAFPMIWAPDIDGKIRGDQHQDFTIEFEDVISGLDFGLMGELYASRGPFGLALRFNYMDLSKESITEQGLITTELDMGIKAGVNDLLASWQVHEKVRLLTGIRHIHNKVVVDVVSRIGETEIINTSEEVSVGNDFDLLFGMTFDHWFSERWGVMVNGDIGVIGDSDRDFSAEFRGLYRFGKLNNIWFGYRYLSIGNDIKDGAAEYSVDMTQSGPMLGWAFTF